MYGAWMNMTLNLNCSRGMKLIRNIKIWTSDLQTFDFVSSQWVVDKRSVWLCFYWTSLEQVLDSAWLINHQFVTQVLSCVLPKLINLIFPWPVKIMFSGLNSSWTTPTDYKCRIIQSNSLSVLQSQCFPGIKSKPIKWNTVRNTHILHNSVQYIVDWVWRAFRKLIFD